MYKIEGLQGDGTWKTLVELDESIEIPNEVIVQFLIDGEAQLRRVDANGLVKLLGTNPSVAQPVLPE